MEYVGLEVPNEPPTDFIISQIIKVFRLANRGRSYISGMAVMPLPLSVENITSVLIAHPSPLDRMTLDAAIFAIDDAWLSQVNDNKS